ncbi:transposase domain-containing protein [Labeo rohita]|uniref:Transposase domain-containing protein n=1 Tax=Labeo rohita TaxID=84645 RepID=A0A498MQH0_LABRO|nr:transposase domain-containing protein [Labeo rohita]
MCVKRELNVSSCDPHTLILTMCVKRELNVSSCDPHTVILTMCVKRELNVSSCDSHTVILTMCVKRELNKKNENTSDSEHSSRELESDYSSDDSGNMLNVVEQHLNEDLQEQYDSESQQNTIINMQDQVLWYEIDRLNDSMDVTSESNSELVLSLEKKLSEWAMKFNISMTSLTHLLKILKEHDIDVPADGRTLLKTPCSGSLRITEKSGGKYTYFGLKEGLTHTLSEQDTSKYDHFEISLNIDGLPIFKSINLTMWPLQCAVINIDEVKNSPFVVALYSGAKKPDDLEFLRDFMEELQELMETGFKGKRIVLKNIICDAPARALIKGIVQFNGRYGCDFCDVKGVHESKMLFLYKGNLRTNESFRQKTNPEHHKTDSILLNLDIDMIRQFPVDPMHCVDLGVTKRMLMLWKEGPLAHRLSAVHLSIMTYFHQAVRQHIPPEFSRKPRGLDELKHWKATEFRTFLLYTGPVILKYVLDKEKYIHFLSLSIGMRILYSENLMEHRDYADELLTYFGEKGDYDQANQYISDYTTGVSAAEDSITYSMTDPAVVELPEKRKRKNKLCDESDINSETSSCEDTLQRSVKKDEDDPKPTSSDVSEFHDLQQHHMTYKEIPVQTRTPDDVHLKKSRNAMKRVGLKTKNVQLAKTPRYHGDCLDDNNESPDDSYLNSSQPNPVFLDTLQGNVAMHEDDHPKSSASSGKEPKETKCKVTMEKLFDLNTKILQQIQMLEQRQAVIMNDMAKVKSVLMKRAEEDAHEELFKQQQCSSFETFEAFCQRLEDDKNYRELYVHYLIHTHGSSNIGEMVRQALKSIASDNVLCLYNRTGKDGKKVLPPVLLTCLKKCVRSFHKQNEIEVTVEGVIGGSVVLPCSSAERDQDTDEHWRHNNSKTVYDITEGKDSIDQQDPRYKNRAATFPDEHQRGNFSIKLNNLQHTDAGEFSCFITPSDKQGTIKLIIKGV